MPLPAPATDKPANDNEPLAAFLLGMRGQVAALAGLPLGANPYSPDSIDGLRWIAAWAGARAELFEAGVFARIDRDMA